MTLHRDRIIKLAFNVNKIKKMARVAMCDNCGAKVLDGSSLCHWCGKDHGYGDDHFDRYNGKCPCPKCGGDPENWENTRKFWPYEPIKIDDI